MKIIKTIWIFLYSFFKSFLKKDDSELVKKSNFSSLEEVFHTAHQQNEGRKNPYLYKHGVNKPYVKKYSNGELINPITKEKPYLNKTYVHTDPLTKEQSIRPVPSGKDMRSMKIAQGFSTYSKILKQRLANKLAQTGEMKAMLKQMRKQAFNMSEQAPEHKLEDDTIHYSDFLNKNNRKLGVV